VFLLNILFDVFTASLQWIMFFHKPDNQPYDSLGKTFFAPNQRQTGHIMMKCELRSQPYSVAKF